MIKKNIQLVTIRGIKHDFPFINIHRVPRIVLNRGGSLRFPTFPRDLANVNE